MKFLNKFCVLFVLILAGVILQVGYARDAAAQIDLPPFESRPFELDSGLHSGAGTGVSKVFEQEISIVDAAWLRLHFGDYNLGENSYLRISSGQDQSSQKMNGATLEHWKDSSAFFNGSSLVLELFAAPGDENIFFRIVRITVGEQQPPIAVKTLCDGDDDRIASTDSRVGRILAGGCTAFLVSNGAVLTAGHCVDFDPDDGGPGLPDGVLDLTGVMEFNVPASLANGTVVMAAAADQYPIDTTDVEWHYDGENQGIGKDWAVFGILPNTVNGDLPHVSRGFFRVTRERPSTGSTIRITGFGADDDPVGSTGGRNAQNKTEQTDTGAYSGEGSSGTSIWHSHRADTRGASSGSPIIWNTQNVVMGIHTNGGCTSTGGSNSGTSFEHDPLETALDNFPGTNVVYVDRYMPALATESGTIFRPYNTVNEGIAAAPVSGVVSVVEGTYPENIEITKAVTITAPVGIVTIGD